MTKTEKAIFDEIKAAGASDKVLALVKNLKKLLVMQEHTTAQNLKETLQNLEIAVGQLNRRKNMRAVVKVMLKGDAAKKILSVKDTLEDMYGLTVSKKGRVVEGLAEDLDDAGQVCSVIREAMYDGETEYI